MAMLRSLLLLILLLVSIQAGPVMAVEGQGTLELFAEKLFTWKLSKTKSMEDFKDGWKSGSTIAKPFRKENKQITEQEQNSEGGRSGTNTAGFFVNNIIITDGSGVVNPKRLTVVSADITAPAAVRVGLCGSGSGEVRVLPQQSSIELLDGDRELRTVKPLMMSGTAWASPGLTLEACPSDAGGGGAWDWAAVLGLGRGGVLSLSFGRFSYQVRNDGRTAVWFPQQAAGVGGGRPAATAATGTTPLALIPMGMDPSRYYVQITGIQISGKLVPQNPMALAYLSTTEPYTILDSAMYGRITDAIVRQMQVLNPAAKPYYLPLPHVPGPDGVVRQRLCYLTLGMASPWVPSVGIVFANNVVMGLTAANVWSYMCLAILPSAYGLPR